ncbi:InlB B-repeat-containing protein [Anaeromyxobacter sp. SG26]|uniref:InlB B-repeat-containing protein n=1 Tax=Anaeromyxobacter sp. SG26 TaxID=2925407 RepID=UPI001F589B92|nr:hypothetical protein [Anaeromyxobacter sp. SG26]
MRGKLSLLSLLWVVALLACNGAGDPERGALESTDFAVVNQTGADVFPPPTGSQAAPAAASDGTNHLVVWSDARGGTGQDLYGARVSKAGVVLGSAPIVISAAAGDQVEASVAFDGRNYLVVWQDSRGATGRDVYGARVTPDGTVLDPGGIPISTALDHQVEPALAFDGTSYLVVWEDRRTGFGDVRGARVAPNGTVLATDLVISGAPLHQTQPAVACATGTCLVAWRDGRAGGPDVYGARVAGSTVTDPDGLPISRAGSSQGRPTIASDGSGFLVTWNDTRSGTSDVYGSRVSASGQVLDPSGLAIAAGADAQQAPDVGFEGAYYVVAWHDRRSGTAFDVYAARVTSAGAVIDPSGFLVGTGTGGVTTSVSSDRAGRVLVAFDALLAVDPLTTVTRVRTQAITVRAELTASLIGNGSGSVVSDPAGVDCGATCAAMFDAPTVVTLTPSAAAGSAFVGWSGACAEAGLGPCTLTVDESRLAIAKFSPLYALTVTRAGAGTGDVTSDPAGIACGATCAADLVEGTVVTLSATPSATSVFAGWSGACSGTGTCVVPMSAAQSVTATFVPGFKLTVSNIGGATGTVSGGATGPVGTGTIACTTGSTTGCTALVASGDSVTLRAAPGTDAVFKGWTGGCTGLGDCTLTMSAAKTVTASFQPSTYTVKVSSSGGGVGTITGEGISCTTGSTTGCSAVVANTTPSTVLTLTATPDASSVFKSWSGCTSSSGNTCSVTVSSAKNVNAVIQPSTYPLTVTTSGSGGAGGTVTGPGLSCTTGSTAGCSAIVGNGDTVILTAAPDATSVFKRWSGCTTYDGATCTVTMTGAKTATAYFEPAQYKLTVTTSGTNAGGTVTGAGVACTTGSTDGCSAMIANGATVTLTATPDASSIFRRWSGCTTSDGATCTVTMTSAKTATAYFEPAQYKLSVAVSGVSGASGSVSGPGIACQPGATDGCSTMVANGATVTLVAEPAAGSIFKSWSGCTSVDGATCSVSMTSAKTATATFQPSEYPLTVSISSLYGSSGSVSGPGITCTPGATTGCSTSVATGTTITLVAEPAAGSIFKSWTNCTSVSGTSCTVAMTAAKTVTATFQPSEYPLTVSITGTSGASGSVSGPGISCTPGATTGCSSSVANGDTITLVAEPAAGSLFKSWTNCTSVSGTSCTVTMTAAKTVTAAFMPSEYPLTVSVTGTYGASGTVSGPGISCVPGATTGCSTTVPNGATVTLLAAAAPGSIFKSWTGCTAVDGASCSVTMTSAKTVTATFQPATFTLTVTTTGLGHGTVSGPGIACTSGSPDGCTAAIDTGTTVTLSASPSSTCDTFAGWSGGGCTGTGTCTVTMTAAKTVSASFGTTGATLCYPVVP